jgi:hypothetical protein
MARSAARAIAAQPRSSSELAVQACVLQRELIRSHRQRTCPAAREACLHALPSKLILPLEDCPSPRHHGSRSVRFQSRCENIVAGSGSKAETWTVSVDPSSVRAWEPAAGHPKRLLARGIQSSHTLPADLVIGTTSTSLRDHRPGQHHHTSLPLTQIQSSVSASPSRTRRSAQSCRDCPRQCHKEQKSKHLLSAAPPPCSRPLQLTASLVFDR